MRVFAYQDLPQQLFRGAAGDASMRLYEDKGRLASLKGTKAARLAALEEGAFADSVDASARIEGLYVDHMRVRELIDGAEPVGETESQIAGYARALSAIHANFDEMPLTTTAVLALYEALYSHRNLGMKSRYRKKDYLYVQVDGHMEAMPVSPITAFETPLVLGGACDSLVEAFSTDAGNPLVLAAVFTVDFLCIRPFDEGNGRIARLFAELMLAKAGFDVARYVSIDHIIERNAMDYYNALNACVEGWDRNANDYTPFVVYWLGILHEAYQELFAKIETSELPLHRKTDRVVEFVFRAAKPVTKRQLREQFPDISEATIENALGTLVREGQVDKLGAGRSTAYQWRG